MYNLSSLQITLIIELKLLINQQQMQYVFPEYLTWQTDSHTRMVCPKLIKSKQIKAFSFLLAGSKSSHHPTPHDPIKVLLPFLVQYLIYGISFHNQID